MAKEKDLIDVYIGERVRCLRESKKWSRAELAQKARCEPLHITRCEQGQLPLTPRRLLLIALALSVTPNDLLPL